MPQALGIVTDIGWCARCDGKHKGLVFRALRKPMLTYGRKKNRIFTHWALCPTTKEPIMLEICSYKE